MGVRWRLRSHNTASIALFFQSLHDRIALLDVIVVTTITVRKLFFVLLFLIFFFYLFMSNKGPLKQRYRV